MDKTRDYAKEHADLCYPLESFRKSLEELQASPSENLTYLVGAEQMKAHLRLISNYCINDAYILKKDYQDFVQLSERAVALIDTLPVQNQNIRYESVRIKSRAKIIRALRSGGIGKDGYESRSGGLSALHRENENINRCFENCEGHSIQEFTQAWQMYLAV